MRIFAQKAQEQENICAKAQEQEVEDEDFSNQRSEY